MGPRYSTGVKVRIKAHDSLGRVLDPKIQFYENMIGEVLEATNIVAFRSQPWLNIEGSFERIRVYHYTVRINERLTLHEVMEDCLEMMG